MYRDRIAQPSEASFLRYSCVETQVGTLLVLMSESGVVDVILGDTRAHLLERAVQRFPGLGFIPDRGRHATWVSAVIHRLDSACQLAPVPLDLGFTRERRTA